MESQILQSAGQECAFHGLAKSSTGHSRKPHSAIHLVQFVEPCTAPLLRVTTQVSVWQPRPRLVEFHRAAIPKAFSRLSPMSPLQVTTLVIRGCPFGHSWVFAGASTELSKFSRVASMKAAKESSFCWSKMKSAFMWRKMKPSDWDM